MKFKLSSLSLAALLVSTGVSAAQTTPAPVIDLDDRRESVVNLESQIALREIRLEELRQDIVTLDGRIEKRVDSLVKLLADTRDSQNSKTKVSKIKKEAILGLRHSIEMYVSKRKEIAASVKAGNEAALGDLSKFDNRIATRVNQIVELTKSFPGHEDVKKYEADGSDSYWRGYYHENSRISEEWKQNRRDASQAKTQRDEVVKALNEGIERLDQRRRSLQDMLDNRNPSASARKLYNEELGQIAAQSENLKEQLAEMAMPSYGALRTPSLDEAINLEQLLDDTRKDLRNNVSNLFHDYDNYSRERARQNEMKENLQARKEWLEKNAPAAQ